MRYAHLFFLSFIGIAVTFVRLIMPQINAPFKTLTVQLPQTEGWKPVKLRTIRPGRNYTDYPAGWFDNFPVGHFGNAGVATREQKAAYYQLTKARLDDDGIHRAQVRTMSYEVELNRSLIARKKVR